MGFLERLKGMFGGASGKAATMSASESQGAAESPGEAFELAQRFIKSMLSREQSEDLDRFLDESSPQEQIEVILEIVKIAEQMPDLPGGLGLAPFLYRGTNHQVLSTAAMYFCGLAFPNDGDVTAGAKMVMDVVDNRKSEDELCGSLVSGILLLGDGRFSSIIDEAWRRLGHEGRIAIANARTHFPMHAHIQFLMGRLRECEHDDLFSALAATLGLLGQSADQFGVIDQERVIPVSSAPENPICVKQRWTKPEYVSVIGDGLRSLAALEDPTGGRVMPHVARFWGVPLEDAAAAQDSSRRDHGREFDGESFRDLAVLLHDDVVPIAAWAIVNPFGPTLMGLMARESEDGKKSFLSFSLNPFGQDIEEVEEGTNSELESAIGELVLKDAEGLNCFPGGAPTLMLVGSSVGEAEAKKVFHWILKRQGSLSEAVERIRRFPGNPWSRISEEVSGGLGAALRSLGEEGMDRLGDDEPVQNFPQKIDEYLELIRGDQHIREEVKALATAWKGAIDFQSREGSGALADDALAIDQLVPILARFIPPNFSLS